MRIKRLDVRTPQGLAGELVKESAFVFNYGTADRDRQIAIDMPLRAASYTSGALPPIMAMNLPEGYIYDRIVNRMAKHERIDDMRLLAITGKRQIGRLEFAEPAAPPFTEPTPVSLERILQSDNGAELFEALADQYFDAGISGMQPKVLVPNVPGVPRDKGVVVQGDVIVKTGGEEYPDIAQNEFLTMDAARRAGLDVPDFWLSDDRMLFVMSRFDRVGQDGGDKLGFEDFAVLFKQRRDPQGNYKYMHSYEALARAVQLFCGQDAPREQRKLFQYVAFTSLVRNGDGHLKNFGLLYRTPGGPRWLAPLFDQVCTAIYPLTDMRHQRIVYDNTLALKLFAKDSAKPFPDRRMLIRFGEQVCNVADAQLIIDKIGAAMLESLDQNETRVSHSLHQSVSDCWRQSLYAMTSA